MNIAFNSKQYQCSMMMSFDSLVPRVCTHAMKFDCNKDDFSTFSTMFFDLVSKGYS